MHKAIWVENFRRKHSQKLKLKKKFPGSMSTDSPLLLHCVLPTICVCCNLHSEQPPTLPSLNPPLHTHVIESMM